MGFASAVGWAVANPLRALRVLAHVLDVVERFEAVASPFVAELRSLVRGSGLPPQGGAS